MVGALKGHPGAVSGDFTGRRKGIRKSTHTHACPISCCEQFRTDLWSLSGAIMQAPDLCTTVTKYQIRQLEGGKISSLGFRGSSPWLSGSRHLGKALWQWECEAEEFLHLRGVSKQRVRRGLGTTNNLHRHASSSYNGFTSWGLSKH